MLVRMGTGALGSAITKAFLESNATVISSYVNDMEIGQTQNRVVKWRGPLVKANLTNETEAKKLVSEILDKYESIDILINMIGAYLGG